jgi:hypothetical protein
MTLEEYLIERGFGKVLQSYVYNNETHDYELIDFYKIFKYNEKNECIEQALDEYGKLNNLIYSYTKEFLSSFILDFYLYIFAFQEEDKIKIIKLNVCDRRR